jgi:colanic acid biosynthesis glycosyl transferase WcaI
VLVAAARRNPDVSFVINGDGAALADLRAQAADLANVRFGAYQPDDRLAEVLATADVHLVSLRAGLAAVSVPSKVYSILAAGRSVIAAVDPGSEIDRLVTQSGAGLVVPPGDVNALSQAVSSLARDSARRMTCGTAGRAYIERHPSSRDAAQAYVAIVGDSLSRP